MCSFKVNCRICVPDAFLARTAPILGRTERSSVVNLRCKDGPIHLERGGAAPDDLHLRSAALTKNALEHACPHEDAWPLQHPVVHRDPHPVQEHLDQMGRESQIDRSLRVPVRHAVVVPRQFDVVVE